MFETIEDKEKYYMQPYINGEKVVLTISSLNGVVKIVCINDAGKTVKLDNKIKKELRKCYESSRFNGFNIVINGFLTIDKKNITYLMCYDLFLKDEYEGKMQSKKLSIRYENLNIRFLNQKLKLVRTIFNHEYSDQNLDVFIKMFI